MGAATIEIGEEIVDEMRKRGIAATKGEASEREQESMKEMKGR
jgi:hypothetical protein